MHQFKYKGPVGIVLFLAIFAIIGTLWAISHQVDNDARKNERDMVQASLNQYAIDKARLAIALSESLKDQKDLASTGLIFKEHLDIDQSIFLNSDLSVIDSYIAGNKVTRKDYKNLIDIARPIIEKFKRTVKNHALNGQYINIHDLYSGNFSITDEQLSLITVSILEHNYLDSEKSENTPIYLINVKNITENDISEISNKFNLKNPRLIEKGLYIWPHEEKINFSNIENKNQFNLVWTPNRPGRILLFKLLPPISFILIGIGFIGFMFVNEAQKATLSLVASENHAKHLAMYDCFTGLANRNNIIERLEQAMERARRSKSALVFMVIGIDRFKEINDTYGHNLGDELILALTKLLNDNMRSVDMIGRINGDEFALILPDLETKGAGDLAMRLLELLNKDYDLSQAKVFSTVSIGISSFQTETTDAIELVRQADMALNRSKSVQQGLFSFFEPEMDASIKLKKSMEKSLRDAVLNDEITLAYQPQVDDDGTIKGVEALCRWTHPARGPISPACFIPLAEECGLMDELGFLVMRRAFYAAHLWPSLTVAINISGYQMKKDSFIERIDDLILETGTKPSQIEIEITESLLLSDDERTCRQLASLRERGFSIALDDFGTGYSSLSYLNRYPIDKIKIDRSFVSNLGRSAESFVLLSGIIKLIKSLRLNVIAEGVETYEQKRLLAQIGCRSYQGFGFSKPVSAEDITTMIYQGGKLSLQEESTTQKAA